MAGRPWIVSDPSCTPCSQWSTTAPPWQLSWDGIAGMCLNHVKLEIPRDSQCLSFWSVQPRVIVPLFLTPMMIASGSLLLFLWDLWDLWVLWDLWITLTQEKRSEHLGITYAFWECRNVWSFSSWSLEKGQCKNLLSDNACSRQW